MTFDIPLTPGLANQKARMNLKLGGRGSISLIFVNGSSSATIHMDNIINI